MKVHFTHIFSLFLVLTLCSFAGVKEDIAVALQSGDAFKVSAFFKEKVDITIKEESDLLSKLEAEKMLYDFFYDHPPTDFKILHNGESNTGLQYTIGKLTTQNGNFRVSFYLNTSTSKAFIQQIIIDAE